MRSEAYDSTTLDGRLNAPFVPIRARSSYIVERTGVNRRLNWNQWNGKYGIHGSRGDIEVLKLLFYIDNTYLSSEGTKFFLKNERIHCNEMLHVRYIESYNGSKKG